MSTSRPNRGSIPGRFVCYRYKLQNGYSFTSFYKMLPAVKFYEILWGDIRLIHSSPAYLRRNIIRAGDKDLIENLAECCLNILHWNIPLTPYQLKRLRKFRKSVYKMADQRLSIKEKKKVLLQRNGFLSAVLNPTVSFFDKIARSRPQKDLKDLTQML